MRADWAKMARRLAGVARDLLSGLYQLYLAAPLFIPITTHPAKSMRISQADRQWEYRNLRNRPI